MKRIFTYSLLLTFTLPVISQTTFQRSLGNNNSNQWGYDITQSYEGGFVITGRTDEDGVDDILFLKVNSKGDIIKNRNIGGANVSDYAKSICKSNNNKYAICGMTRGYAKLETREKEDAFYVQVDQNMQNAKLPVPFGGKGTEIANNIISLKDGHFLISIDKTSLDGFDNSGNIKYRHDCFLIKITSDGNQVWLKDFTDIGETWGNDLLQATDGKIYLAGTVKNRLGNDRDVFICKLNSSGSVLWKKPIYAKVNHKESSQSIIEDKEGNFILTGKKISPKQSYPLLIKINSNGGKLMEEYYDVGYDAGGNDIVENKFGELILVGSDYGRKGFVLHLDTKGKLIDQLLFKPSISKIIKGTENDFVLLGEELLDTKFRSIFLKKTNIEELKSMNKSIDADVEKRSKELFYGDLPPQTNKPILNIINEAVIKYALENDKQDFQDELNVKIKETISVKLNTSGKAIESNVVADEKIDEKRVNLIEQINYSKLKDLTYEPATWKGYKVNVLYDRALSEYYKISQFDVKIKSGVIWKTKSAENKYFGDDESSFERDFLKVIQKHENYKGDGKYRIFLLYSNIKILRVDKPSNIKIISSLI